MPQTPPEKSPARWRQDAFWIVFGTAVILALLGWSGAVERLEHQVYDQASRSTDPLTSPGVVVVAVDNAPGRALAGWPHSREAVSRVLDPLVAAGARTVVLADPLHPLPTDPSLAVVRQMQGMLSMAETTPLVIALSRAAADAEAALTPDLALATRLQRAGSVLLVSRYDSMGSETKLPPALRRSTVPVPAALALPATRAAHPSTPLVTASAGVGHLQLGPDADGVVRRIPLMLAHDGGVVPSVAVLALLRQLHLGVSDVKGLPTGGLSIGGLMIPTDANAVWRPRFSQGVPAHRVTAEDLLAGKVSDSVFRDKLVLVGRAPPGLREGLATPGHASVAPVDVLAQLVVGLSQGQGVIVGSWAQPISWLVAVVMGLLAFLVLPRLHWGVAGAVGCVLAIALLALEWALLRVAGWWQPLTLAALVLVAATASLWVRCASLAPVGPVRQGSASDADRMMGLALHGQGQLDMAFERFRQAPASEALLDNLYHLAQDCERQRQGGLALAVYEHILRQDRRYKDVQARYRHCRATHSQAPVASPTAVPPLQLAPAAAAPSSDPPQLPGAVPGLQMLGRYRVDRVIGKGSMGAVYRGRDPKIGRVVAIKTLALGQEFEGEALIDARSRFFREAETAGRLQHPCIVTIFDAGEEHELAYIAMELLQGSDLATACQSGQLLPVRQVVSIIERVAQALDYAHAHQVVHRDIKPANIMFDPVTDVVKVTDFGIARITDSSKTRTGLVLGTPSFMSPEQLAGKRVDGRTDLYSLGVTLFQMLTGVLPLRGESMTALMQKIAKEPPPDIRQLRPDLPQALAEVVARALEKKPEARFQTGRQFAEALQVIASGLAVPSATLHAESVDYDAGRNPTDQDMADFPETVIQGDSVPVTPSAHRKVP